MRDPRRFAYVFSPWALAYLLTGCAADPPATEVDESELASDQNITWPNKRVTGDPTLMPEQSRFLAVIDFCISTGKGIWNCSPEGSGLLHAGVVITSAHVLDNLRAKAALTTIRWEVRVTFPNVPQRDGDSPDDKRPLSFVATYGVRPERCSTKQNWGDDIGVLKLPEEPKVYGRIAEILFDNKDFQIDSQIRLEANPLASVKYVMANIYGRCDGTRITNESWTRAVKLRVAACPGGGSCFSSPGTAANHTDSGGPVWLKGGWAGIITGAADEPSDPLRIDMQCSQVVRPPMPSRATFYTRFWSNSEFLQAAFAKGRDWRWYFAIGARDSQRYYDFRTSNVFNSVPHVCNPPAPGKSYGLCSRSVVGAPKTVTFNDACGNGTELAVTWVNPSCQGIHTGDIPVGQSLSVATYVGQVLQIRDKVSGAVVSEFVVRDTDDQITVPDSLEGLAHDWPSVASCETTPCPQGMQCTNTTTGPQCSCPSGTVPSQGTCVPEGNPRCNFPQPLTTIGNVSPSYATPEKVFRIANRCGDGDVVGLYWVDSTGQEHRMQELPPGGTNINSYIDHVFRVKNERVKPDPNNPNAALPPTTIGEFIVRDDRDTKYIPDMF